MAEWRSGQAVELPREMKVERLRALLERARVRGELPLDPVAPVSPRSILAARRAGREEAMEASIRTGIDFTTAYENMCRWMAASLNN